MNTRDIILSLAVHVVILFSALVSAPFEQNRPIDYGEVIRVSLPSMDQLPAKMEELPPEPVPIPRPVIETDEPDIPIKSPETKPAAKIDKPKPKPTKEKPKEETRKTPTPEDADKGSKNQEGNAESQVNAEVTTSSGTVLSGATVDNANFNYPYWFTQAFYKISGAFRNPINYDGTLKCVIHFEVMQSGRIYNLKVLESSGVPQFDQACLASVERSTPLPPLPKEFLAEVIGINLPFNWEPR